MSEYEEILNFYEKLAKSLMGMPIAILTAEQKQQSTRNKYCDCSYRQHEKPIDDDGNYECFDCGLEINREYDKKKIQKQAKRENKR